jgi:TPR repeat protein/predicted aspartyl protease
MMRTAISPNRLTSKRGLLRCFAGSILLITLALFGCNERAEVIPTSFEPQLTTIDADSTSIPWDADEDMPVVPVMINGKGPFRFLIDTGASYVLLDQRLAERLHLTRHGAAMALETVGKSSVTTEQPAVITSLAVGGVHFSNFNAAVLNFTPMEIDGDLPIQIDGILGSALFAHSLLTMDYPKRMVHIAHGSLPALDDKNIFPLILRHNIPYLMIRLETAHQIQDWWAMIDTGSNSALGIGTEWGLAYSTPIVDSGLSVTASGQLTNHHARIERMRLGSFTFTAPEVNICDGQRYARIGQDQLNDLRLTLDFPGQRARFETAESTIPATPSWSRGFSAHPSRRPGKEGFIVNWIASGSPAAQVMRLGDRLLSINGQDTAHMSNRTCSELMRVLQPVDLTIERSGIMLKVSVPISDQLPVPVDTPVRLASPESGQAFARYALARMYIDGNGVIKDDAKAVAMLQLSADQGDAGAQNALGKALMQGLIVTKDVTKAAIWFHKAAEQGLPEAQRMLGKMYTNGRGVAQNNATAFEWFHKAAIQGISDAQLNLGIMYAEGRGVTQNDATAFEWIHKAAAQEKPRAQRNLGVMYANGRGVAQNDATAFEWIRKAAAQNDDEAQYNLGVMYAMGRGVAQNGAAAIEWLSKASAQGNADAQYALGLMFAKGNAVAKDENAARTWFQKAADQGHEEAKKALKMLRPVNSITP